MALYHLFQPKSSFLIYRIRLLTERTRCILCSNVEISKNDSVEEEKSISAIEPSVKENKIEEISALCVSKEAISLSYLFRKHNCNQTETIAENEGKKPEESLSDTLLNLPKDRNLQIDHLSSSNDLLPSVATDELHDDHLVDLLQNEFEDNPLKCEKLSYEGDVMSSPSNRTLLLNELGKISKKSEKLRNEGGGISSSIRTQKILELKDFAMKQGHEQEAKEIAKPRSLFTHQFFEDSNKPCSRVDEDKGAGIKELIDFMKLQDLPSITTEDYDDSGPIQENSVKSNVQTFENSERFSMNSSIGDEETSMVDSETIDHPEPEYKETTNLSVPRKSKHQKQLNNTPKSGKVSEKNKVILRFLRKNITERHILEAFASCGEIFKIEIPDSKLPLFKVAHLYFKTTEGFEKALQRNGILLTSGVVIVESATSMEKITPKIPIPSLIGDPNIPALLVKNPTRTIKIENLTREMSSHHIEEALAFCETNISGYFLGSSNSIAYVEFETEIGKERALAKHCINVLGKNLEILRIDAPRTTVLRISNIPSLKSVFRVCESLGKMRSSLNRCPGIVDVNFALAEWPNMLNILNRLNGLELEGKQLRAEPAPVFPADVLLALWDQPEERKLLKTTMQDLMHKVGQKAMNSSELPHLVDEFVDEI